MIRVYIPEFRDIGLSGFGGWDQVFRPRHGAVGERAPGGLWKPKDCRQKSA